MGKEGKESAAERFRRIASARTNKVLEALRILGNCANRQNYEYTEKEVDKIFSAIDRAVKETRALFRFPQKNKFKL